MLVVSLIILQAKIFNAHIPLSDFQSMRDYTDIREHKGVSTKVAISANSPSFV
jgi:hypothetical protein